jgi:hypothetical protein
MRPMAVPAPRRRSMRATALYRPLRAPIRRTQEPLWKLREFWISVAAILMGLTATWFILSVGFWLTNH